MAWQYTPVTLSLVAVTLISAGGAFLAWNQRQGPTEIWGSLTQFTLVLWSVLMLCTVSSTTLEWKLFWLLLFFPMIPTLSVTSLCFTAYFTGRGEWVTRRRLLALLTYPSLVFGLSITNWYHDLVVADPTLDRSGAWTVLVYEWGPGFWLMPVLSYSLGLVILWWLLRMFLRSRNVYRKLSFVILAVNVVILGSTVPSAFQVSPLPHFLLMPHAYLLVGGILILATTSVKFARLVPVDSLTALLASRFGSVVTLARDFVVEEVDNGIIMLDDDGLIVDINQTATKMIGVERPVGNHIASVTSVEDVEDPGALEPIITGAEPVSELEETIWLQTANGRRCYDVRISELSDGTDTTGHVILLHDITHQKEREETLERQKAELQRQNERLDQFASIVSHDLRNPLTVAEGYLQTLEQEIQDASDADEIDTTLLAEIHHSQQRMEAIIEDALTLAREGKAITETEPVQLSQIVTEAWENVDTKAATLECATNLEFEADRGRLLNLLENLIRNAIQHGGTDVTVRAGALEDQSGFFLEDDGPGIPEDRFDLVLDHGYTTHSEGTGLGLAIVNDIAQAHGWAVTVTNGPTGGARFEFSDVERRSTSTTESVASVPD